jgi:hypothetical protein
MRKIVLAGLCLLLAPVILAQQALNNESVLKLVKSGLSDDLIITTIKASPGNYDTSPNGLIALKKGGASDKVVEAIVVKANGGSAAPASAAPASQADPAPASGGGPGQTFIGNQPEGGPAAPAAPGNGAPAAPAPTGNAPSGGSAGPPTSVPPEVDSVGVYYQDQTTGSWQEVGAEVVNFKTGGVIKHLASAGIIKGDVNGLIGGTRSKLALHAPAQFIFYVPEGRAPGEYQLLHLRLNPTSREFRATTGGVAHESGGAIRDTVDYSVKKIAPRIYAITLGGDLAKGEYGFLPPLDSSNNIASSGKIYTFALVP